MDEQESMRTIRRLTKENAALRDANETLHGRLAQLEAEFRLHGTAPQELRDDLLSLAMKSLEEERTSHYEALDRERESYHASIENIEKMYEKAFQDSEAEWKLNYHRSRGKIITASIFVVVLIYASSVYFTYLGAERGLEAALRGRSLEFSFSYATAWYCIPLLCVIAWRLWHWRHPPTPQED